MRTVAVVNNGLGHATDNAVLYDTDYCQHDDAQKFGEAKSPKSTILRTYMIRFPVLFDETQFQTIRVKTLRDTCQILGEK